MSDELIAELTAQMTAMVRAGEAGAAKRMAKRIKELQAAEAASDDAWRSQRG